MVCKEHNEAPIDILRPGTMCEPQSSVTADIIHSTLYYSEAMVKEVEKQEKLPKAGQVGIEVFS